MNDIRPQSSADALLIEGGRSYLEASNALLYFKRQVQKKCRDVMESCLGKYEAALGVELNHEGILEMDGPKIAEWDGSEAWLGAKLAKDNVIPGIRWWGAYCGISWSSEDPKFGCCIGEWFPTQKMAANLAGKFRPYANVEVIDREVSLYQALAPDQAATFDTALAGLFQKWVDLWKKVGGMKKVFKAT